MKKRFIYHDEKSNKFWWIDYEGDSLAVNYGKVGSIGKFQTKEFDNEEQCLKEASKLIAAKMKKGYQEDPKFNFMDRYYFDDEEIGLHVKTSHPNFQCHFTDPLYMCCWDEESPFGSDEGADALNVLENSLRKEPDLDCADFPQMLIETMWGMKYI
ncbi:WGR domain-containing protein, partial [Escherichia coli O9,9a:H4]